MYKLEGECIGDYLLSLGRRRAVVFMGPVDILAGEIYVLELREGFSAVGAPTPEALEYCIAGLGKFVKKLDSLYTLDELIEEVPEDLKKVVEDSNCVKYAFYSSRVDPRLLKPGVYVTRDPILFFNLGRHFPLYSTEVGKKRIKTKCKGSPSPPLVVRRLELKVLDSEEFFNVVYWSGVRELAIGFIYKLPLILLKLRRRL